MDINICGILALSVIAYYLYLGWGISTRMAKHTVGAREPVWMAAFQDKSYTPEGQRLLAEFRKWAIRLPLVALAASLGFGLLCRLIGL